MLNLAVLSVFSFCVFDISIFYLKFESAKRNICYYLFFFYSIISVISLEIIGLNRCFEYAFWGLFVILFGYSILISFMTEISVSSALLIICSVLHYFSCIGLIKFKKRYLFSLEVLYFVLTIFVFNNAILSTTLLHSVSKKNVTITANIKG